MAGVEYSSDADAACISVRGHDGAREHVERCHAVRCGGIEDVCRDADLKLQQMRDTHKRSETLAARLTDPKAALSEMETDMASGDLYSWVVGTFRKFKTPYKVEIPQLGPLGPVTEMSLLPAFPYKQATLTVAGRAHFHDFGRFLADFENNFPHMRVLNLNLEIEPAPQDPELISFRMDVAILIKSNPV